MVVDERFAVKFALMKDLKVTNGFEKEVRQGDAGEYVSAFLRDYFGKGDFRYDFEQLTPVQRVSTMLRLMGYVTPRLKAMELSKRSGEDDGALRRSFYRSLFL